MQSFDKRPIASIILPTYNEKGNITRLIKALYGLLNMPVEFLVVDDNSPDGTADEVKYLSSHLPNVRLLLRTKERGLTSAIQCGIDASRGEVVVWMDCDLSMPPETVPELVYQILVHHMDAAIGSRYVPKGSYELAKGEQILSRVNKHLSRILNWTTQKASGVNFYDWTSGFIAIRATIIKSLRLHGDYGEYFINLMANIIAMDLEYVEVPYTFLPRECGESKTTDYLSGYIRRGLRYLPAVLATRRVIRTSTKARHLSD